MRFRKKPVEVEAVRCSDVLDAMEGNWKALPEWIEEAYESGVIVAPTISDLTIKTLEGDHLAHRSDWIIQGVKGELYPCKPEIFDATYEPA
jgi:hypothetical protein